MKKKTDNGWKDRRFRVGERVTFRFVGETVEGLVVEDRGPLAAGRRLYRIQFDGGSDQAMFIELTPDRLTPVP